MLKAPLAAAAILTTILASVPAQADQLQAGQLYELWIGLSVLGAEELCGFHYDKATVERWISGFVGDGRDDAAMTVLIDYARSHYIERPPFVIRRYMFRHATEVLCIKACLTMLRQSAVA